MQIIKSIEELRPIIRGWRKEGLRVGLVPTMGYLHDGHKSLIVKAVSENEVTADIWSKPESHFQRLSDQQIGAMGGFFVRPAGKEAETAG